MDIKQELERIQQMANDIWFFVDRILTHPDLIKQQLPIGNKDKTPITELGLSARALKCLERLDVEYVDDLVQLSKRDLLRVRNMGEKTFEEINEKVKSMGLHAWSD